MFFNDLSVTNLFQAILSASVIIRAYRLVRNLHKTSVHTVVIFKWNSARYALSYGENETFRETLPSKLHQSHKRINRRTDENINKFTLVIVKCLGDNLPLNVSKYTLNKKKNNNNDIHIKIYIKNKHTKYK